MALIASFPLTNRNLFCRDKAHKETVSPWRNIGSTILQKIFFNANNLFENLAELSEPIRIPSAKLLTNFWC